MIHELKILPEFFHDVFTGLKTFEVRKNDRNFKVGDILKLIKSESDLIGGLACIYRKVTYILKGGAYGIDINYVVLGLGKIDRHSIDLSK